VPEDYILKYYDRLTSAAGGAEEERGGGAAVTVPADDAGPTAALTPAGLTHGAEGPLRVTLACWGIKIQDI